jgi:hypothetical protein
LRYAALLTCLPFLASATPRASGFAHVWQVKEAFSNADGSIQFIEMFDSFSSENFIQGSQLIATSDGSMKTFTFPINLPGDTAGKHLLIATPGFAALPGAVTPDFTLPDPVVNGMFFNPNAANISIRFSISGDTINFTGASLPKDGLRSLTDTTVNAPQTLVAGTNSPTNYNVQTGALLLGDYNRNRLVDGADYVGWRNTLTQAAVPAGSGADGNLNSLIDAGDYTFWRGRFGNTTIPGSGAAVPEPAAVVFALAWLFLLGWRQRVANST